MNIDISRNPRITQLLGRVDELRRALRRAGEASPERQALLHEIDGFYKEIGRYVHWLMRQDPAALARIDAQGAEWAEAQGRRGVGQEAPVELDDGYLEELGLRDAGTEEPSVADITYDHGSVGIRTVSPDDDAYGRALVDVEVEPIDDAPIELTDADLEVLPAEPAPPPKPTAEPAASPKPTPSAKGARSTAAPARSATPSGVRTGGAAARDEGGPSWKAPLKTVLGVVGPPEPARLDLPAATRAVRKLVNATTNLDTQWETFPPKLRRALLAFLGARVRHLQRRLPNDMELRLVMERLQRHHATQDLGPVSALDDRGRPGLETWDADAAAWHQRLAGMV